LPLPLLQSAVISVWFRGRRRTRDLYTVWRSSTITRRWTGRARSIRSRQATGPLPLRTPWSRAVR
jgi:hypothetical protein